MDTYLRRLGECWRSCLASDFVVLVLSETVLVIVIELRQARRSTFWAVMDLAFVEHKSKPVRMVAMLSTT